LEPFTVHNLRRTGSTLLNELGFNNDWIEECLLTRTEARRAASTTKPSMKCSVVADCGEQGIDGIACYLSCAPAAQPWGKSATSIAGKSVAGRTIGPTIPTNHFDDERP
jgi:hypothetical protein